MKLTPEQYRKLQRQSKSKLNILVMGKESRECKQCKQIFVPRCHGGKKIFCSHLCANRYTWANRPPKLPKQIEVKNCSRCGAQFKRPDKYSNFQWSTKKFCSIKCGCEARKINDGLTNAERSRRKKGVLKKGSPEWIERIRATTIEGMAKPEVRDKLSQPRAPLSEEAISYAVITTRSKNHST